MLNKEIKWLAALDFETTGVDPKICLPVSVAFCLVHKSGKVAEEHQIDSLIDCGVDIPAEATACHGITNEKLIDCGKPERDVLRRVLDMLSLCEKNHTPVVIFNAPFDWTLLHRRAKFNGYGISVSGCQIIDPLVLDRHLDKYRPGKRTLGALCAHLNIALDMAHAALWDASAAAECAFRQLNTPALCDLTPNVLQEVQRIAFEDWRDGYVDFLRNEGKEPEEELLTRTWPGGL